MAVDPPFRRMLLALDPDDWPAEIFDSATRLAAMLTSEIEGLYVEDSAVASAAALSATRLVSVQRGEATPADLALMRRALRARAASARARFEASARRTTVHWRFATAAGNVSEQLVARTRDRDLIVLAHAQRRRSIAAYRGGTVVRVAEQAACSVLLLNRWVRTERSVLAIYEGNDAVLAKAAELARAFATPLTVLVLADGDAGARSDAARSWLADHGLAADVRTAAADAQACAAVRALRPGLTVAAGDGLPARGDALAALAAETSLLILK